MDADLRDIVDASPEAVEADIVPQSPAVCLACNRYGSLLAGVPQCFFISRNIGQITPKNIYFHYLKNAYFWIKVSKKIFDVILKTKALVCLPTSGLFLDKTLFTPP